MSIRHLGKLVVILSCFVAHGFAGSVYSVASSSKYYTVKGTKSVGSPPTITSSKIYTWPLWQTCSTTPTSTSTVPGSTITVTISATTTVFTTLAQSTSIATSTAVVSTSTTIFAPTSTSTSTALTSSTSTVSGATITISTSAGFVPIQSSLPTAPASGTKRRRRGRVAKDDVVAKRQPATTATTINSAQYVQSYVRYNWFYTYTIATTTVTAHTTPVVTKTAAASTAKVTKTVTIISSVLPAPAKSTTTTTITQVGTVVSTPVTTTTTTSTQVEIINLPASTYYAACAPNNILNHTSDGLQFYNFEGTTAAEYPTTDTDAYNCCVSCINIGNCDFAFFEFTDQGYCQNYVDLADTCAVASVPLTADALPPEDVAASLYFSNEEFIRKPNNFTPVLEEENAQMSELGGGRANNGGARAAGPVPVASSGTPSGLRTPRDVMRARNAREQQKQEELKAEEARRAEERRRSAERRAATLTGGAPRLSQASSAYTRDSGEPQGAYDGGADRTMRYGSRVSGVDQLGEPVGRTQEYPSSRTRGSTGSQQEQPRPAAPAATSGTRRTQQSQPTPRQPSGQTAAGAASSQSVPQPAESGQRGTSSSFPHAFERWEQLSSHWEGLTSYWLHKLEGNAEEIRNTVPNASTLSRQITDLSAAGANLFHAVVELQRLRASSERKFQRWFFETRADKEKQEEIQGGLDRQLKLERSARDEAVQKRLEAEAAATKASTELAEMRRELNISKEEARRAWEELGRRNQESLDTAEALKNGRIAVVSGVQVVPYYREPSRTGSASQRPGTREGVPQYGGSAAGASSAGAGAAGLASLGDDDEQYGEYGRPSPTNTDPFTEHQRQPLHHEPDVASLATGTYRPYPAGTDAGMAQKAAAAAAQRYAPPSTGSHGDGRSQPASTAAQPSQQFYQHAPQETFLHSAPSSSAGGTVPAGHSAPTRREDLRSEPSYVDTLSEGDTEYVIEPTGQFRHDDRGRPIVFQQRPAARGGEEEADEPYDDDVVRSEAEYGPRYGGGGGSSAPPEAPSVPASGAQGMAAPGGYPATSAGVAGGSAVSGAHAGPDYEGSGYGGWEQVQTTRHHHPTRLSDVLEEEEERSSRRTGEFSER
ncbi:hypothetical protein BAUCODRAFT_146406 [Baudoinia panamericana UAMH 10762]|uniref:Apple domain-containing protein n=1 Tax=Baudoinia panamericana (strain UAMH 10762) TaxID=717646 RepID=M2MM72_BAUPA|nr:uncharacterized protein BAUCODRAFT_146406 [Baudoinia panamericana UAMH 10762]EMC97786.1 hypothetical protein BAUCODRAFT_146406 [Baudoinia panamericana UAMH 10762]